MILHKALDLLFTSVFLALALVQSYYVTRDNERMFRNLHVYERNRAHNSAPSTYFNLDWLMHPISSHYNTPYKLDMPGTLKGCYSSGMSWEVAYCGPQFWQTSDSCATKSISTKSHFDAQVAAATVGVVDSNLILSQFTEDGDKRSLDTNTTHMQWRNPNLADVCRLERIPSLTVIQNDDSSWSIGAAHSSSLLLLGAALIMFLSNFTNLLHEPPDSMKKYASKILGVKGLIIVAIGILLVFVRVSSTRGEEVIRVIPNGSYFYVIFTLLFGGTLLVNMKKKFEKFNEVVVAEVVSGSEAGMGGGPGDMKLNVSGFVSGQKTQLNAYMPRTAPSYRDDGKVVRENAYDEKLLLGFNNFELVSKTCDIQPSRFCTTQAFALPLLTLGVFIFPTNYEIDSHVQLLFMTIFMYSLIDIVIHRLDQVTCIFTCLLIPDMKNKSKFTKICRWVDVLGLLAQVMLFSACFVYMHWHLTIGMRELVPVMGDESLYEIVMSWMPILYILYFVTSNLVKMISLYTVNRMDKYDSNNTPVAVNKYLTTIHKKSQFILYITLNVFVAVVVLIMSVYMWTDKFTEPITMKEDYVNLPLQSRIKMYRSSSVM